jgi:hypothetical protein
MQRSKTMDDLDDIIGKGPGDPDFHQDPNQIDEDEPDRDGQGDEENE